MVTEPTSKRARGIDGRAAGEWYEAGALEESTIYHGVITRLDRRWTLQIQWVDLDNQGHRIVLPHQVVQAIRSGLDRVIDQSNSDAARRAAETRKEAGVIPFQHTNTAG